MQQANIAAAPAASAQAHPAPLLQAHGVRVEFSTPAGRLCAVDGVDLSLAPGETLALVGESGCGKSTLARALIQLQPRTAGSVQVCGVELNERTSRRWLSTRMQMVFQDPDASLNPRMTMHAAVAEPLLTHAKATRSQVASQVEALLERVGIDRALAGRYPHELSGGQKQRVCIARALAVQPQILICDEAVSALDVSVRAQILNLLQDLQQQLGVAYLFITHDLSVVRHLADRVSVMYLGGIVEQAPTARLFEEPKHPYTRALLSAVPRIDAKRERVRLIGDVPSAYNPPSGCRFHTRCPERMAHCAAEAPPVTQLPDRVVRCYLWSDNPAGEPSVNTTEPTGERLRSPTNDR